MRFTASVTLMLRHVPTQPAPCYMTLTVGQQGIPTIFDVDTCRVPPGTFAATSMAGVQPFWAAMVTFFSQQYRLGSWMAALTPDHYM